MNIVEMIATVGVVTEFIKRFLSKWMKIEDAWAVALSIVVSVGVVFYYYLTNQIPIDVNIIWIIIQVIAGANGGYNLLKVTRPKKA